MGHGQETTQGLINVSELPPGYMLEGSNLYQYVELLLQVVSCLDIYARVGANRPLVIPDLKTFVNGDEGLTIRFEGVTGSPIVCGISIRKDSSACKLAIFSNCLNLTTGKFNHYVLPGYAKQIF